MKTFDNSRAHYPTNAFNSMRFLAWAGYEMISCLPALIRLRFAYRKLKAERREEEPLVAWVGDNLDEVNGIALNSRIMVRKLRAQGKRIFLLGVAFHGKKARLEGVGNCIFMAPGRCSMDQPGYPQSEIALPRLKPLLPWLRKYPLDLIEFQTPSAVPFMALYVARIVGIRTLSHYRTDLITYARMLIPNALGAYGIQFWTKWFTRLSGPVVVPSEAFRKKVAEMGVPAHRIHKLPRGVDLTRFHPSKRDPSFWERFGLSSDGLKLLYVGRVSREKNLELLVAHVPELLEEYPDSSCVIVGEGPYLEEMRRRVAGPRFLFTGVLEGDALATAYASADLFLFPSTTDTFGNTVLEALSSGVPCLVSNEGGPVEMVTEGVNGFIFPATRPEDFRRKLEALMGDPEGLGRLSPAAREKAMQFTYENSAKRFWEFYCKLHKGELPG